MKLIVQIKNIYGVNRIYPVCEKSKTFSRIAGLKTLQPTVIDEIKKLGYKIETRGEWDDFLIILAIQVIVQLVI